jgi:hypothetical protein
MKINVRTLIAAFGISAACAAPMAHSAALLGEPVPTNLIVTVGNLEWVYASPCAGESPSCGGVVLSNGFDFATAAQWNASFTSLTELATAFDNKCASAYFDTAYNHCDYSDIMAGYVWHSPLAPSADQYNSWASETFLVREVDSGADVPEPASLALFGLGLAGLAARRYKARNKA